MPTTYCVQSDVEAVLSEAGVTAFADDDEDGALAAGETGYITRAIDRAANKMNALLESRYILSDLSGNTWCRDTNADIAAFLLTSRRGNAPPQQIADAHADAMEMLAEIKAGRAKIPEQPESFDDLPTVSNYTIERGAIDQPVRVDVTESTGAVPASGIKRHTRSGMPGIF